MWTLARVAAVLLAAQAVTGLATARHVDPELVSNQEQLQLAIFLAGVPLLAACGLAVKPRVARLVVAIPLAVRLGVGLWMDHGWMTVADHLLGLTGLILSFAPLPKLAQPCAPATMPTLSERASTLGAPQIHCGPGDLPST
jgi:hypothetical protein